MLMVGVLEPELLVTLKDLKTKVSAAPAVKSVVRSVLEMVTP